MLLFDTPYTFIDIETTGMSPLRDRIIEIAMIRIEKGAIVETFETLINPDTGIPREITTLTGITAQQLLDAPRFFDVKDTIKRLTKDSIFVAHNANFDYGFIKQEFKRYEEQFSEKRLCTVKLFRHLEPTLQHHNLDSLIEFFGIQVEQRHRAFADTEVLWKFIELAIQRYGSDTVHTAIQKAIKGSKLPQHITKDMIQRLPQSPGVYLMYGEEERPLYIGKSINIKDRVLSHFSDAAFSSKEFKIAQQVKHIESRQTSGELSALLLEAQLIKQYQPVYNRMLRKKSSLTCVEEVFTDGSYATVHISQTDHISPEKIDKIISVFRSQKQAKEQLLSIAREHSLCPRLLKLENGTGACFWHQLGWCKGACVGKESKAAYNLRFRTAFSTYKFKRWPYTGAIIVKEESDEHTSGIVIDTWCILGVVEHEQDLDTLKNTPYYFDIDTYKILARYLFSHKNYLTIQNIQLDH